MKKILINNKEYVFDITRSTYEGLSTKRRKQYREDLKGKLKKQFNDKINDVVKRLLKIQDLLVIKKLPYHDLVYEAKMLYVEGYFYATIALCGVVGENIARMILINIRFNNNRTKGEEFWAIGDGGAVSALPFTRSAPLICPFPNLFLSVPQFYLYTMPSRLNIAQHPHRLTPIFFTAI